MTINTKAKEEKQTTQVDPEWANWVRQVAVYTVDDLTRNNEIPRGEMGMRLINLVRELEKLRRLDTTEAHDWTQIYIDRIRGLIDATPLAKRLVGLNQTKGD